MKYSKILFVTFFILLGIHIIAQEKKPSRDSLKVIVLISCGYNGDYRIYNHRSYADFKIKKFREIISKSFYYKLPKEIKDGDEIYIAIKKRNFFGKYIDTHFHVSYEDDRKYLILNMNIGNKKSHPFDAVWTNKAFAMTPDDIWDYNIPGTLVFKEHN